jgi:hypothetical protein
VDPVSVYWSDCRCILAVGLGVAIGAGIAFGPAFGLAFGFTAGLTAGLGPAMQLTMSQLAWWLRGRRVLFLPLLQTALDRQVLRQAGAVYQFRHAALQDVLKTQWTTPGQGALSVPRSRN